MPILSAIAIVGCLIALLTTSDRSSVLTRAGIWALSATAFFLLLGFGVPWLLVRFAPDQAQVLGALTTALLRTTLMPSLVLAICGAVLVASAIIWPSADSAKAPAEAPVARAQRAPRGPVWPGPVPQPLVYPEPDWGRHRGAERPSATDSSPVDSPATSREGSQAIRPPRDPAPPRPDPVAAERPPPLPTVASVSRREEPSGADRTESGRPEPESPSPIGLGPSGRLPTKEQGDRPSKLAPTEVDRGSRLGDGHRRSQTATGHARHVEGVGWVVPGPPPDRS